MDNASGTTQLILSVLFFPSFFQGAMMAFAWGAGDAVWVASLKRVFLLLPFGAVVLGLWTTILCLLTVVIRQRRREFITKLLLTWWDLGRATFNFWGGIFRFLLAAVAAVVALLRGVLAGAWLLVQDVVLIPFRLIRAVAANVTAPGFPWIAVLLTFFWCLIEATIFTYVMTPLVLDTLSNLTGETLHEAVVRIPLFVFLLFLILGSYAVLAHWTDAVKSRNAGAIVRLTAVELVAILVEVLFLYREFVDALVPWFAQYGSGFEPGAFGLIFLSTLVWLGVRGMTWFLFAAHGTPVLLAMIQGAGIQTGSVSTAAKSKDAFAYTFHFYYHLRADYEWVRQKGDDLLAAFLLPPLQVVAAGLNFLSLLVSTEHLFELPFQNVRDLEEKVLHPGRKPKGKAAPKGRVVAP